MWTSDRIASIINGMVMLIATTHTAHKTEHCRFAEIWTCQEILKFRFGLSTRLISFYVKWDSGVNWLQNYCGDKFMWFFNFNSGLTI
jgi:hypothetical protein